MIERVALFGVGLTMISFGVVLACVGLHYLLEAFR